MQLSAFLTERAISMTAFSRLLKVSPSTVHGWLNGRCFPRARTLAAIERATGGAVTAADFVAEGEKRS
jgi:DNA-binding transcriptional regulator YdaS (Cro superfamily)